MWSAIQVPNLCWFARPELPLQIFNFPTFSITSWASIPNAVQKFIPTRSIPVPHPPMPKLFAGTARL